MVKGDTIDSEGYSFIKLYFALLVNAEHGQLFRTAKDYRPQCLCSVDRRTQETDILWKTGTITTRVD